MTPSADEIRANIPGALPGMLDALGASYRRRGGELRTRLCPTCGERSTDCVCIEAATGRWIDHAHGCRGDVFALVAGLAGLDVARDYPKVVKLTAELAGLTSEQDPERERRITERRRAEDDRRRREQAEQARLVAEMADRWTALDRRSNVGERYLAGRGLDPKELRDRGDVVRFSPGGDPAVALRDLASGAIVGIQYRKLSGDGGKLRCERGSQLAGSALSGRASELDPDGVDVAVIVEGLADVLAAHLAFPGCAIFGAAGWQQLERIAGAIAPRVMECRGWLLISVDDDEQGVTGAAAATNAAREAGLTLDRDLHLLELGEHHDLADAYRAGWRFTWPEMPS